MSTGIFVEEADEIRDTENVLCQRTVWRARRSLAGNRGAAAIAAASTSATAAAARAAARITTGGHRAARVGARRSHARRARRTVAAVSGRRDRARSDERVSGAVDDASVRPGRFRIDGNAAAWVIARSISVIEIVVGAPIAEA